MGEKLEITLRITLDRAGLERRLGRPVDHDQAFFVLGMVYAQLSSRFGEEDCTVEMTDATGVDRDLLQPMNAFARELRRTLRRLDEAGEAVVDDPELLAVLQITQEVMAMPEGGRWRVTRSRLLPTGSLGGKGLAN